MIRYLALLSLALFAYFGHPLQRERIDLTQYGFEPTQNATYRAQKFNSSIEFMSDGTLIVAFRIPEMLKSRSPAVRELQPVRVLHLDRAGHLLSEKDLAVNKNGPFLWTTADGAYVLFQNRTILFMRPDAGSTSRTVFTVPRNTRQIVLTADRRTFIIESIDSETRTLKVIDSASLHQIAEYAVPERGPWAVLEHGYAYVTYDSEENQKIHFETKQAHDKDLSVFDDLCPARLGQLFADSLLFAECRKFTVYRDDMSVAYSGELKDGEGAFDVTTALNAPRFALQTIYGADGFPPDMQRQFGTSLHYSVIDLRNKRPLLNLEIKMPKLGNGFALSPDGTELAILEDGFVEIVHVPSSSETK